MPLSCKEYIRLCLVYQPDKGGEAEFGAAASAAEILAIESGLGQARNGRRPQSPAVGSRPPAQGPFCLKADYVPTVSSGFKMPLSLDHNLISSPLIAPNPLVPEGT